MNSDIISAQARPLTIAGVCERDLDLLFLEEFSSSPEFAVWFVHSATDWVDTVSHVRSVKRSVTHGSGESDLLLQVSLASGRLALLLIENKVDAGFQKDQAARYAQRAREAVGRKECDVAATVILAPERYFSSHQDLKGFEHRLTYQAVRQWFVDSALGQRKRYKLALIDAAIQKATLGYQPIADAPVTDFWRSYWMLATREGPELEMPEPTGKGAKAAFIYFRSPVFPKGVELVHKLPHGFVDLQLSGWGARVLELRRLLQEQMASEMTIEKAEKSGVIRLRVPALSVNQRFDVQYADALKGVFAAKRLFEWYLAFERTIAPLATDGSNKR